MNASPIPSDAEVVKYIEAGGQFCPFCGPRQEDGYILGGPVEIDSGTAYQEMTCTDCGAGWTDEYVLTRISVREDAR